MTSTTAGGIVRWKEVVDEEELVPTQRDDDQSDGRRELWASLGGEDPAENSGREEVAVSHACDAERRGLKLREP